MAKKIGSYYYLINGNEAESKALYVPYQDSYLKGTKDISEMDLATLELGTSFVDRIQEANPSVELHNKYYLGKYPFARGIKIFKPIEVFKETDKSIKIVNGFKEIAEERLYDFNNSASVEPDDKTKSVHLIEDILNQLSSPKKRTMFSKESIIGKQIKKNYFDNKYLFDKQMSNYTQLRNLLINYLCLIDGRDIPHENKLYYMSQSLNNMSGLEYESPESIANILKEYKEEIKRINDESTKEQVMQKIKNVSDENGQLNIFDMFGVERPADEPKNRGRVKNLIND